MENNMNRRYMNNNARNMQNSARNSNNGGNNNNNASCEELMCAIMEADFFAQDLKLYLDTHPDDTRAVEMFREDGFKFSKKLGLSPDKTQIVKI